MRSQEPVRRWMLVTPPFLMKSDLNPDPTAWFRRQGQGIAERIRGLTLTFASEFGSEARRVGARYSRLYGQGVFESVILRVYAR